MYTFFECAILIVLSTGTLYIHLLFILILIVYIKMSLIHTDS